MCTDCVPCTTPVAAPKKGNDGGVEPCSKRDRLGGGTAYATAYRRRRSPRRITQGAETVCQPMVCLPRAEGSPCGGAQTGARAKRQRWEGGERQTPGHLANGARLEARPPHRAVRRAVPCRARRRAIRVWGGNAGSAPLGRAAGRAGCGLPRGKAEPRDGGSPPREQRGRRGNRGGDGALAVAAPCFRPPVRQAPTRWAGAYPPMRPRGARRPGSGGGGGYSVWQSGRGARRQRQRTPRGGTGLPPTLFF